MHSGEKLWKAFVAVEKVLLAEDLMAFARALFMGTAFKSLSRRALRTATALALKLDAASNVHQVYTALALQSWGFSALREIEKGIQQAWPFHRLTQANQNRIILASNMIEDFQGIPTERNKGDKGNGGARGVGIFVALLGMIQGVMT